VAGIYNRASYSAEKRQALDRWADHLLAIVGESEPFWALEYRRWRRSHRRWRRLRRLAPRSVPFFC